MEIVMLHDDMVALLKAHGAKIKDGGAEDWSATLNEHELVWRKLELSRTVEVKWLQHYLPAERFGCSMPLGWSIEHDTNEKRVAEFIEYAKAQRWLTKTVYVEFGPDGTHPNFDLSLRACPRGWKDKLVRDFSQAAIMTAQNLCHGLIKPETLVKWMKKNSGLTGTAD